MPIYKHIKTLDGLGRMGQDKVMAKPSLWLVASGMWSCVSRIICFVICFSRTHNHSHCIRPELPPYNVTAQNATFCLAGNLSSIRSLNVWRTVLAFDGKRSSLFKKLAPIKTKRGKFTLYLEPDQIYTLTTLSSGNKGKYPMPPSSKSFPLPYRDNFEEYPEFSEMNNFAAQNGVFEVRRTSDNAHGKVNRQVMLHEPIYWCENRGPTLNLGGNSEWTELVIFIDAFVPSVNGTDGVFVAAAVGPGGCGVSSTTGYFYTFFPRTGVYVTSLDIMRKHVLLNGTYPPCPDTWFTLQIVLRPSNVTGFINSKRLFSIDTYAPVTKGFAAYGTTTYGYADFDNLFITGPRSSFKEFGEKRFNTVARQKL